MDKVYKEYSEYCGQNWSGSYYAKDDLSLAVLFGVF